MQGTGAAGSVCKVNDTAQEAGDRKEMRVLNTRRKGHFPPCNKYMALFEFARLYGCR